MSEAQNRQNRIVREVTIPGGHGAAIEVKQGQLFEIVDLEGQQVADLIAFSERNRVEWMSPTHTRSYTMRLNLHVGDQLQSNWRRPMLEILSDDVGQHDVITSMCDRRRYLIDYGVEDHRSCRSNYVEALAEWGINEWEMPDPFNIFQNAPVKDGLNFGNERPTSKPGDRILFRCQMDLIAAVSACPQDLNPCNGFNPTPILIRVYDE